VALIKYPADPQSSDGLYKGILLVNPGGPGASGVVLVRQNGSDFQKISGTNWDIVGFDPRGMFESRPTIDCAQNLTNSTGPKKRQAIPRLPNSSLQSIIDDSKRLGAHCNALSGGPKQAAPHMTSTTNARDLVSIADAFAQTEDGKKAQNPQLVN
jgi:alpha/beta hydrolase fold